MTKAELVQIGILSWRVYGFAIVMALLAIIPGCNFLYSGHGGLAWLILPLVFPFTLFMLYRVWRTAPEGRTRPTRFAIVSLVLYFPISLLAAMFGAASIENTFGLPVEALPFWGFFILPLGLIFNSSFFGL
jgi:hypothetical protein